MEKPRNSSGEPNHAKLPKLQISKFKGTQFDWFRFWNQFEAEFDRKQINPITKFNCLKEFLDPKLVNSLIFLCKIAKAMREPN